ncbi:MAG TPA: hypothetical protein VHK90_10930 [Thermoanaerobaculia bacterium]|nr:hypothetical protein [Thermoanaerobaculia bacterium]
MNETEWDSLSALWTSTDVEPLRAIVAKHRRRLLGTTVCEAATIGGFAWLTWIVLRDGVAVWELVWALTLWAFAAIAVAFAWWNRRGTWSALGDSVAEYVRLTKLRAERQRNSLRFSVALFFVEVVAIVAQLWWFERLTRNAVTLLVGSGAIVAAWIVLARRKIARDSRVAEDYERFS